MWKREVKGKCSNACPSHASHGTTTNRNKAAREGKWWRGVAAVCGEGEKGGGRCGGGVVGVGLGWGVWWGNTNRNGRWGKLGVALSGEGRLG